MPDQSWQWLFQQVPVVVVLIMTNLLTVWAIFVKGVAVPIKLHDKIVGILTEQITKNEALLKESNDARREAVRLAERLGAERRGDG